MKLKRILLILLLCGVCKGAVLPSTNLLANWRADTGITITGAGVSKWDDQSGNGHHLTQTVDADRPVVVTIDSLDSIFFNNKHMNMPVGLVADKRASSIFMCYRTIDTGTQSYVHFGILESDLALYQVAGPILNKFDGSVRSSGIDMGTSVESAGLVNGASVGTMYSGRESTELLVAGAGDTSGGGFVGLWDDTLFELQNTHIYEIAIYSAAVSESVRNSVLDYFSETYGALSRTEDTYIVYIGDSLTEGSELPSPQDDCYPEVLARLHTNQHKQTNLGNGGDFIQVIAADPSTYITALTNQAAYDTRFAVLWAGTNDINGARSSAQVIADLDSFISQVRSADANSVIVGCTITPREDFTAGEETIRLAVNVHILGAMDTDRTVDLASVSELSDSNDVTYYKIDGIHHNVAGTDIVAVTVNAVLFPADSGYRGRYENGYRQIYRSRY